MGGDDGHGATDDDVDDDNDDGNDGDDPGDPGELLQQLDLSTPGEKRSPQKT